MGLKPGSANCGSCGPSPQPVVNDLLSCFKWLRKIKRIIFCDSENYMKQNFCVTQIFIGIQPYLIIYVLSLAAFVPNSQLE